MAQLETLHQWALTWEHFQTRRRNFQQAMFDYNYKRIAFLRGSLLQIKTLLQGPGCYWWLFASGQVSNLSSLHTITYLLVVPLVATPPLISTNPPVERRTHRETATVQSGTWSDIHKEQQDYPFQSWLAGSSFILFDFPLFSKYFPIEIPIEVRRFHK